MSAVRVLVTSQKGGVGKSTIAANLAAYFAEHRAQQRVALIDFDHQATSSAWTREAPARRLAVHQCDVHKSRDGTGILKMKKVLRDAGRVSDLVIGDLTWVDVLPADLMLDYDVVLVPTSLSRIEIASTLEFFSRFAHLFNSDRAGTPRLVLLPNRLDNLNDYHGVLAQDRFPVRFSLATPVPYSLHAQELFGRSYFYRGSDDALWSAFLEVCGELEQVIEGVRARRKAQPVVHTLDAVRAGRGPSGILDRFKATRTSAAPVAPQPVPADARWFGFLRKRS